MGKIGRKKIPQDTLNKILSLLTEGKTCREIAMEVGVAPGTISKIASKTGIALARRRGQRGAGKQIREDAMRNLGAVAQAVLLDPGADLRRIAAAAGVSATTAARALERMLPCLDLPYEDEQSEASQKSIREFMQEKNLRLGVENAKTLARAARERWAACADKVPDAAGALAMQRYHRAARAAMRCLRRFVSEREDETANNLLAPEERIAIARAYVAPAEILHPAPAVNGRCMRRKAAEAAAKAQSRQYRAGVAVAPGTEVFGAYAALSVSRPCDERDATVAALIAAAAARAAAVNEDMTVAGAVAAALRDKELEEFQTASVSSSVTVTAVSETVSRATETITDALGLDLPDGLIGQLRAAFETACMETYILGRHAARKRARRALWAWAGGIFAAAGYPALGLMMDQYYEQAEEEIAAAAAFFPEDPAPDPAALARRWKARNAAALRWASRLLFGGGTGKRGKGGGVQNAEEHKKWKAVAGQ